jgi:DNA-binding MarR family transcriptional regulator
MKAQKSVSKAPKAQTKTGKKPPNGILTEAASHHLDTFPCISKSPRLSVVELLWSFGPAFQRYSESLMTEKGLSPQRLRILSSLNERGPRIMSDLKEELGVTATNITALVDSLERDGLVTRQSHPTDRRATVIQLTEKSVNDLKLGCTAYKDRVADLFSDLSDAECREFIKTLKKLWHRLQG